MLTSQKGRDLLNLFKIGNFAKNLGVSTGFLKHHERYGLLNPVVAENGYRYYEYKQAMLVFQCLKLQKLGFGSKEITKMLAHSDQIPLLPILRKKKNELDQKVLYYQCVREYLSALIQDLEMCENQDCWKIDIVDSFYYMENSIIDWFNSDPDKQKIAEQWNEYAPLVDTFSRFEFQKGASPDISNVGTWHKGICISQKSVDLLGIYRNDTVQKFERKLCLMYTYNTICKAGTQTYIEQVLDKALTLCRDHRFEIAGDLFTIQYFSSTAKKENRISEVIFIPIL